MLRILLYTKLLTGFCLLLVCNALAQAPTANFTYTILNGKPCGQAHILLSAASSTGNPTNWVWSGAINVSGNPAPTANLIGPGNHTITLIVSNANGQSQPITKTIVVYDTPKVNFTGGPLAGCPPLTVNFTPTGTQNGAPGSATYKWISSPGIATGNPGSMSFGSGLHDVTLQVTNSNGCMSALKKTAFVNVYEQLQVDFSTPQTVFCDAPTPNLTFTPQFLVPTTAPYSYAWNLGQGPASTQFPIVASPSKIYGPPKGASYQVSLTVTDGNGCSTSVVKPQYIKIMNVQANFTGPASACIGTAVTFTSTSSPSNGTCDWSYGPGEQDDPGVQPSVTHTFVTSGTKTVRMITTVDGCKDTAYKTIVIHPKPTINFTHNPDPPCPAPSTVTFTGTGASSYHWDFGDGTGIQGPATTISHTYSTCGLYSPTIFAVDGNGCKDTLTKVDKVKVYCGEFNIITSLPKDSCAPHTVAFGATSSAWWYLPVPGGVNPYPVPVATYNWNFGITGATSNLPSPSYTYTTPGVYKVTLKVVTTNGCSFYDTLDVFIGSKPITSFVVDTVICAGQPLLFVNTSTIPVFNGGYIIDEWSFGDNKGAVVPGINNIVHKYDTAGTFCARLIVTYNGCKDTFERCNIRVDSPVAKFTYNLSCTNRTTVSFNNQSYGYTSHKWYFGDGPTSTSTAVNPVHTYPGYGKYIITLVTFNTASGCSDTLVDSVYLMDPIPVLTATDTTICKNDSVRFNAVFTNPVSSSILYRWYVNNVFITKDSMVNFTRGFVQEGYYSLKVVMMDGMGCLDSAVKNNWVLVSKPVVDFSGTPPIGCVPHTVSFTDNSIQVPAAAPSLPGAPLVSRRWEFASPTPGVTVPGPTVSYTYNAIGVYNVKLVVTDASGCKDSIYKPAYIQSHKPVAAFTVNDLTACVGHGLTFTNNTSKIASAKWYFGDGDSSLLLSPLHAYKQPGMFSVTMIATDSFGCKDTLVKPAHISVTKPTAGLYTKDSVGICPPLIVRMDTIGTRDAVAWWWAFQGSNNHPVIPKPYETFFDPGEYQVTLVVFDKFGCTDTATGKVRLLGYDGAFSYTPLQGCAPLEVDFNLQLHNIPSLIWDFSDGNTLVTQNTTVKHIYTVPGAYLPRVIMTDTNGCSSSSFGKDTIKVDGVFAGFDHTPFCEGYKVTFTDTSKGVFSQPVSWHWTFHSGLVYTIHNPTHFYPKAGDYPVRFIVTNANGCKDTLENPIHINELPVVSAGTDTIVCLHDAAQLMGSGAVSYVWSPANTLSCANCPNPLASPSTKTDYTVIGTDANGCSDTDRVVVSLKYEVVSLVGEGGQICQGESVKLKVSGAHRYEWSPAGDLDNSTSPEPKASPPVNTLYRVIAYEGSCIPDTDFVDVTVHPKPTVKAYGDATIVAGQDAPLNAEGDLIKMFLWKPSETLDCSVCPNPIARPINTTKYTVVATSAFGCSDSDDVVISVQCDNSQLFIPNTFTPNGDGQNDVFYPRGVGFTQLRAFRVFNRWGQVVYERRNFPMNDRTYGWDGTFNGAQLPPDVFMYTIEADCEDREVLLWKGDVTLIR